MLDRPSMAGIRVEPLAPLAVGWVEERDPPILPVSCFGGSRSSTHPTTPQTWRRPRLFSGDRCCMTDDKPPFPPGTGNGPPGKRGESRRDSAGSGVNHSRRLAPHSAQSVRGGETGPGDAPRPGQKRSGTQGYLPRIDRNDRSRGRPGADAEDVSGRGVRHPDRFDGGDLARLSLQAQLPAVRPYQSGQCQLRSRHG